MITDIVYKNSGIRIEEESVIIVQPTHMLLHMRRRIWAPASKVAFEALDS